MNIKRLTTILIILLASHSLTAREYKASLFGLKSDGTTNNTGSLQKAIDYISEQGGGTLVFYVGRYLTGSVTLKSNVSIRLEEGAILVGSPVVYDYAGKVGLKSLLNATGQQNITISGKGVIDGQGGKVVEHIKDQQVRGYLQGSNLSAAPALICLDSCRNVSLEGVILRDAGGAVMQLNHSWNIAISGLSVHSKVGPLSAGIQISGCDDVAIRDAYIEVSGKEIIRDEASGKITVSNSKNPAGVLLQQ